MTSKRNYHKTLNTLSNTLTHAAAQRLLIIIFRIAPRKCLMIIKTYLSTTKPHYTLLTFNLIIMCRKTTVFPKKKMKMIRNRTPTLIQFPLKNIIMTWVIIIIRMPPRKRKKCMKMNLNSTNTHKMWNTPNVQEFRSKSLRTSRYRFINSMRIYLWLTWRRGAGSSRIVNNIFLTKEKTKFWKNQRNYTCTIGFVVGVSISILISEVSACSAKEGRIFLWLFLSNDLDHKMNFYDN